MSATFEALCLPHRSDLMTYAMRLCRDRATAEDVVQAAMLKAFEQWHEFRAGDEPDRAARAWLYQIVHNAYIDQYRRTTRRRGLREEHESDVLMATYGVPEDHASMTEDLVDREQICDEVKRALATLSEKHRYVIEQVDLLGRHYSEVADELGIPHMTVTSRLHAARRVLEPLLGGVASMSYGINIPTPDFAANRPSKRRSARARKHAPTVQAPECPQAQADRVDRVVVGLDGGQLAL